MDKQVTLLMSVRCGCGCGGRCNLVKDMVNIGRCYHTKKRVNVASACGVVSEPRCPTNGEFKAPVSQPNNWTHARRKGKSALSRLAGHPRMTEKKLLRPHTSCSFSVAPADHFFGDAGR